MHLFIKLYQSYKYLKTLKIFTKFFEYQEFVYYIINILLLSVELLLYWDTFKLKIPIKSRKK